MTPLSRYVVELSSPLLAGVALCVVLLSALRRVGVGKVGGARSFWRACRSKVGPPCTWVRAANHVYVLAASENALAKLGEMPQNAAARAAGAELSSSARCCGARRHGSR